MIRSMKISYYSQRSTVLAVIGYEKHQIFIVMSRSQFTLPMGVLVHTLTFDWPNGDREFMHEFEEF